MVKKSENVRLDTLTCDGNKSDTYHACEALLNYCAHSGSRPWDVPRLREHIGTQSMSVLCSRDEIKTITDAQRIEFLKERTQMPLESNSSLLMQQSAQLGDLLKQISGEGTYALIASVEEDAPWLLRYGQLWGKTYKMMRGASSQCHSNSCYLMEQNDHLPLFVATGYALSDDGLWRQHSWCVLKKERTTKVIETTERRLAYFGYVLSAQQTLEFADNNTDFGISIGEQKKALMDKIHQDYIQKKYQEKLARRSSEEQKEQQDLGQSTQKVMNSKSPASEGTSEGLKASRRLR